MTPDGPMLEETARRLDDTGVGVLGVEVVRIGPGTRREDYQQALEVSSRLWTGTFSPMCSFAMDRWLRLAKYRIPRV